METTNIAISKEIHQYAKIIASTFRIKMRDYINEAVSEHNQKMSRRVVKVKK